MREATVRIGLLLAAALLGLAPAARAWDPRLPLVGAEATAERKVEGFRRARAGEPALLSALDGVKSALPRDQIHLALLAADPAYRAAVSGFERTGDNADAWRKLLEGLPKDDAHRRAHATYFLGRALLGKDDLESAAMCFELVRGRMRMATPWTDEAVLYLASIYARLPGSDASAQNGNRARARDLLEGVVPSDAQRKIRYGDAPERVVEGARWLQRELRGEGSGPLLELAKRMETIERLIDREKTDDPTQGRQKEVVVTLDRLIELMREKEGGGG